MQVQFTVTVTIGRRDAQPLNEFKKEDAKAFIPYLKEKLKDSIKETMLPTQFETGATTHAVNDLILFTDNTRELVEIRDGIYIDIINNKRPLMWRSFLNLSGAAKIAYRKEFKEIEDHQHIRNMNEAQTREFCIIYLSDFKNWKQDHGYSKVTQNRRQKV